MEIHVGPDLAPSLTEILPPTPSVSGPPKPPTGSKKRKNGGDTLTSPVPKRKKGSATPPPPVDHQLEPSPEDLEDPQGQEMRDRLRRIYVSFPHLADQPHKTNAISKIQAMSPQEVMERIVSAELSIGKAMQDTFLKSGVSSLGYFSDKVFKTDKRIETSLQKDQLFIGLTSEIAGVQLFSRLSAYIQWTCLFASHVCRALAQKAEDVRLIAAAAAPTEQK